MIACAYGHLRAQVREMNLSVRCVEEHQETPPEQSSIRPKALGASALECGLSWKRHWVSKYKLIPSVPSANEDSEKKKKQRALEHWSMNSVETFKRNSHASRNFVRQRWQANRLPSASSLIQGFGPSEHDVTGQRQVLSLKGTLLTEMAKISSLRYFLQKSGHFLVEDHQEHTFRSPF